MNTLAFLIRGQVYVKARDTVESRLEGRREICPDVTIRYSGVISLSRNSHNGPGRLKVIPYQHPTMTYQ